MLNVEDVNITIKSPYLLLVTKYFETHVFTIFQEIVGRDKNNCLLQIMLNKNTQNKDRISLKDMKSRFAHFSRYVRDTKDILHHILSNILDTLDHYSCYFSFVSLERESENYKNIANEIEIFAMNADISVSPELIKSIVNLVK